MNRMVKRLAKKFAEAKHKNRFGHRWNNPLLEFEARWWSNALADEILCEAVAPRRSEEDEQAFELVARWIQEQAKD